MQQVICVITLFCGGMVLDGTVDFAVDTFGITVERMKVADYLIITEKGAKGRLYTKNPAESFNWGIYTMPLMNDLWIVILMFCLLIPFLMVIATFDCKYNNKLTRR